MLIIAIIFFILAALLGLFLLTYVLTDKNTPKSVAILHGLMAASGITLVIIYSLLYRSMIVPLIVFIVAALGGLFIFYLDLSGKKIPKLLAVGHGSIAILGFVLLLLGAFYYF